MAQSFAMGNWHVTEGKEQEFVQRWGEFLGWARETQESLVGASLIRNEQDHRHFISFSEWKDAGARGAWKNSEGFMERFGACRELCDDFSGADHERVVEV